MYKRQYITAAAIDGKTQVDVRGAVLIDAVFSANGIDADTHNVATLCRQARAVFYRRKTWLNKRQNILRKTARKRHYGEFYFAPAKRKTSDNSLIITRLS